jgi:DNA-binding protein YbaB
LRKEVVDPEDVEFLEDLILTAVKKAIEDGKAMQQAEMSKLMPPGMGGLGF